MKRDARWYWLLLIPFLALCFPALYARAEPAWLGMPFFYWYQFVMLVVSSGITAFVFQRTR